MSGGVVPAAGASRRKLPGRAGWVDLASSSKPRENFQRADGSVMTDEEIAKVAKTDSDFTRKTEVKPKAGRIGDDGLNRAWQVVAEHGSRAAAAAALGITVKALDGRLDRYRAKHGIKGLPVRSGPPRAAAAEPVTPSAVEKDSGNSTSSEPVVRLVVHQDGEAHARSYNEGYEQALQDIQPDAITALIDWLTLHGPDWSQAEAERWFRAFTATIDLIYPTSNA